MSSKKIIAFAGPRAMQERLSHKYGNGFVLRNIEKPALLKNAIKKNQEFCLVVRPQHEFEARSVLEQFPEGKLIVDSCKYDRPFQHRRFAVGTPEETAQLGGKCQIIPTLNDLPKDLQNVLTQVYIPQCLRAQGNQLQKLPNVVCYVYKTKTVKSYCIGGQQMQEMSRTLGSKYIAQPQDLKNNPDINAYCQMIIYCNKKDQDAVLGLLSDYRGDKKVIVCKEGSLRGKKLSNIISSQLGLSEGVLGEGKKRLIFVANNKEDPRQFQLVDKYRDYQFKKVQSPEQLGQCDWLKQQNPLLVVGYRDRQKQIQQQVIKNRKSQVRFKYLQVSKKRLIFVSEQGNDRQAQIKALRKQYQDYEYTRLYSPKLLSDNCDFTDPHSKIVLIGHQSQRLQLQSQYKGVQSRPSILLVLLKQRQLKTLARLQHPQDSGRIANLQQVKNLYSSAQQLQRPRLQIQGQRVDNGNKQVASQIIKKQNKAVGSMLPKQNLKIAAGEYRMLARTLSSTQFQIKSQQKSSLQAEFVFCIKQNSPCPSKLNQQASNIQTKVQKTVNLQKALDPKQYEKPAYAQPSRVNLVSTKIDAVTIQPIRQIHAGTTKAVNHQQQIKGRSEIFVPPQLKLGQKAQNEGQLANPDSSMRQLLPSPRNLSSASFVLGLQVKRAAEAEFISLNIESTEVPKLGLAKTSHQVSQQVSSRRRVYSQQYEVGLTHQLHAIQAQFIRVPMQQPCPSDQRSKQNQLSKQNGSIQPDMTSVNQRNEAIGEVEGEVSQPRSSNKLKLNRTDFQLSKQAKPQPSYRTRNKFREQNTIEPYNFIIKQTKSPQPKKIKTTEFKPDPTALIKEENRLPRARQRVHIIGEGPVLQGLKQRLASRFGEQVVLSSYPNYQKYRADKLDSELPSIIVFDQRCKDAAYLQARRNIDKRHINVFVIAKNPPNQARFFSENRRISWLGQNISDLEDQLANYLGADQYSIIRKERRRKHGRIKLLTPASLLSQFKSLQHESQGIIAVKPYDQIDSVDFHRIGDRPTCLVLLEEDHAKLNKFLNENTHVFLLTKHPSQKQALLKNHRISMLAISPAEAKDEMLKYADNKDQTPLLRLPPQKKAGLAIIQLNPNNNPRLHQIVNLLREKNPHAQYHKGLSGLKEEQLATTPGVLIADDETAKQATSLLKYNHDLWLVIYSTAPSQFKSLFSKNENILAVSHKPQLLVDVVSSCTKQEHSLYTTPQARAGSFTVLLVAQSLKDMEEWRKVERMLPDRLVLTALESAAQIQHYDLVSEPTIIQVNQSCLNQTLALLKGNHESALNQNLHLFVRSEKPSTLARTIEDQPLIEVVSHEAGFPPNQAKTFIRMDPVPSVLLKVANRRPQKQLNVVVCGDGSVDYSVFLQSMKRRKNVNVSEVQSLQGIVMRPQQPTLIASSIKQLQHLPIMGGQNAPFFFFKAKTPSDYQKLFYRTPKLTMIAQSFQQIGTQMAFYQCKQGECQPVVKLKKQWPRLLSPTVFLLNFQGPESKHEGEKILAKLNGKTKVVWTKSIERIRQQSQSLIVVREKDRALAYRVLREQAGQRCRLLMLTNKPQREQAQLELNQNYVMAGGIDDIAKELQRSLPERERRGLTKVGSQLMKVQREDGLRRTCSYLRRGEGRLVWNMEEHLRLLKNKWEEDQHPGIFPKVKPSCPDEVYS